VSFLVLNTGAAACLFLQAFYSAPVERLQLHFNEKLIYSSFTLDLSSFIDPPESVADQVLPGIKRQVCQLESGNPARTFHSSSSNGTPVVPYFPSPSTMGAKCGN
jgi:hypothetical protein